MSRNKGNSIRKFFPYDEDTNRSQWLCNLEDKVEDEISERCGKILEGTKVSNLKSHIKNEHPNIYKHDGSTITTSLGKRKHSTIPIDDEQKKISTFHNKKTIGVLFKKEDVIKGIVQMVTVDGRPFKILNDTGFRMLMEPVMKALDLHINVHNIADFVSEYSDNIRNKIRAAVNNSFVSIKIDCVTRLDRSFLGINIQTIQNQEITIYSLSAVEIKIRHTATNLKNLIIQELEKYGIDKKNIYTITTDNGANVAKAVKLIEDENMDNEMDIMKTELDDATNLVHLIQDYDWKSDLNIMSVRCAAHTLQLSILDTLKNSWNDHIIQNYIAIIEDARNVVKELRTQNNLFYLRKCGLPKPLIDCPTRWNSTHDMLERLLQLKAHCEECAAHGNPKLYLPMDSWKVIEEITVCLSPSKKAMKELQYENLTLTDIYKIWNICHFETAELGSPFSEDLLQNLINSRNMMVEHDVFIAALFLDPRFHFEMSSEQKEKAIRHLIWLHNRISSLEEIQSNLETLSDTESTTSKGTDDRDFEEFLREQHRNLERNSKELPDFETICRTFIPPRLKPTEKVIEFWKTNKDVYPSLYRLAIVIFAVPGTQVSVERLFSQLRFILNCFRGNLLSDDINNVLLVRSNADLL